MKHIKKVISYSIAGSVGLSVVASLQGCDQPSPYNQEQQSGYDLNQNYFMVIEQLSSNPDRFTVAEKHPTDGPTRAILRSMDGTERFMSEAELKQYAEEEAKKVEAGTSTLTQDPATHSSGMSMGETIMAAAVGSLIGGMIANRLMGNSNFQKTSQSYGKTPTSAYSRSATPKKTSNSVSSKQKPKSGFFGGNRSSSSSYRSFGG
jgi:hypothetical protein